MIIVDHRRKKFQMTIGLVGELLKRFLLHLLPFLFSTGMPWKFCYIYLSSDLQSLLNRAALFSIYLLIDLVLDIPSQMVYAFMSFLHEVLTCSKRFSCYK